MLAFNEIVEKVTDVLEMKGHTFETIGFDTKVEIKSILPNDIKLEISHMLDEYGIEYSFNNNTLTIAEL